MTEWREIAEADWAAISCNMAPPRFVFDGRNALDPMTMKTAGFEYVGVGLGAIPEHIPCGCRNQERTESPE